MSDQQMPHGAVDLGAQPTPIMGAQGAAMIEQTAVKAGILCTICTLDMEGGGFEFVSLQPKMVNGRPTVVVDRAFVCLRDDCAQAREGLAARCTAYRTATPWTLNPVTKTEAEAQAAADGEGEKPDGD